jgi:SAM-dependent methyltransferase
VSPPTPVLLDGALADGDPELEQLAADPLGAPARVLVRHPSNQLPDLGTQARTAESSAGPPPPERLPAAAVPADDRRRLDEHEVAPPVAAHEANEEPEEPIAAMEARAPPRRTAQHRELLAQEQVLGDQVGAATDESVERGGEQREELNHGDAMMPRPANGRADRLSRPNRCGMAGNEEDAAARRPGEESYTWGYAGASRVMAERRPEEWVPFLLPHLRPGMRLLDVGCGSGGITLGLAERVAPGDAVGVEIAPSEVELARRAAAARGVGNARFVVGSAYGLPFPDGSFDAALACNALEHLADPERALRELRRVLRPGGVVGVRDPDWTTAVFSPPDPSAEGALALLLRVRAHNGSKRGLRAPPTGAAAGRRVRPPGGARGRRALGLRRGGAGTGRRHGGRVAARAPDRRRRRGAGVGRPRASGGCGGRRTGVGRAPGRLPRPSGVLRTGLGRRAGRLRLTRVPSAALDAGLWPHERFAARRRG